MNLFSSQSIRWFYTYSEEIVNIVLLTNYDENTKNYHKNTWSSRMIKAFLTFNHCITTSAYRYPPTTIHGDIRVIVCYVQMLRAHSISRTFHFGLKRFLVILSRKFTSVYISLFAFWKISNQSQCSSKNKHLTKPFLYCVCLYQVKTFRLFLFLY